MMTAEVGLPDAVIWQSYLFILNNVNAQDLIYHQVIGVHA